ncbi:MAG TPA: cytochrome c [Puia sp.]|nr:cytochrome c [Puia sp.]
MKSKVVVVIMMLGAGMVCMKTGATLAEASLKYPVPGSVQRGQKIYMNTCLTCHQADAGGVPGMTPPLQKSPYVQGPPVKLIGIVLNGLNDGVEIEGETYTNPMPPFSTVLKDQEIADVLTYIRSHFGNKAGPITVAQVSRIRKGLTNN